MSIALKKYYESEKQKDMFYRKLKKAAVPQEKNHKLLRVDDFNAETSLGYMI